jgi:phenylacetate-CoA ligase
MTYPHYFESFDYAADAARSPDRRRFTSGFARLSRDEIRAQQDRLFMRCVARAWEIPFYQRLWRRVGPNPATSAASTICSDCRSSASPI